jgi:hypothetical protein
MMSAVWTTITLENENGRYSISVPLTEMGCRAVVEDLVQPLLLAAGYSPGAVEAATGGEGEK